MKLVTNIAQLTQNIETLENYLVEGTEEEKSEVRSLIRRGRCFVAYKVNNDLRFAPSRFLGYINNNLQKHDKAKFNKNVDGKETNPAISAILDSNLIESNKLNKKLTSYCKSFGEIPDNHKHKFWVLNLVDDFKSNLVQEGLFPEGKIVERIHLTRERNSKVITIAKSNFKAKHGRLFCQACGFDFQKTYGEEYIEGHHTIPVEKMKPCHKTSPDDIAMLCANCHRMVHKRRPWLSMDELKNLLK